MSKYKHVFGPEGYHMWQVTLLGRALRSGCNFPSPEEAACSCQLFKHYLNSEFRLRLPESLDGEMFSALAYRRNVNVSESLSVFSSLTDSAKDFIEVHRAELDAHRDSNPESVADKFRRSGMISVPAIRNWVDSLDAAEQDEKDFAEIDSKSFSLRLSVVQRSVGTALNSLGMAIKMHEGVVNAKLISRMEKLKELETNLKSTAEYIEFLSKKLADEEDAVKQTLHTLESNRPPLI